MESNDITVAKYAVTFVDGKDAHQWTTYFIWTSRRSTNGQKVRTLTVPADRATDAEHELDVHSEVESYRRIA